MGVMPPDLVPVTNRVFFAMPQIEDWRGWPIEVAISTGGVVAVVDPWANVISTGVRPWPPPELIQKIYQSRQARAFADVHHSAATSTHGFYSDLQSLHSEDAITWSVFGPVVYAPPERRTAFVADLLTLLHIKGSVTHANVWLWRRLPHPDTLVSGGPEINFGIHTDEVFVLGEAKWRSSVGAAQGVNRDKDQLTLRREFCEKYGRRVLPTARTFAVIGVSWKGGMITPADTKVDGVGIHARDTTWQDVVGLDSHPCGQEVKDYLAWKTANSKSG